MSLNSVRFSARFWAWATIFTGYSVVVGLILLAARFINDRFDFSILLAIQPDRYVPLLDEFIILVTDFSIYTFSFIFLSWQITQLICRNRPIRLRRAFYTWRVLAVVLGLYHAAGVFVYAHGIFWWAHHQYNGVFAALGLVFFIAFWRLARTFIEMDECARKLWSRVFWITLLTVSLSNFLGEPLIKKTIGRPRPLNEHYGEMNQPVRLIDDEIVRSGPSYISGHASSLFALVTPLCWAARRRRTKAALWGWAALHAYSRVYTAAHFPYCAFMGSLFGWTVATLVYMSFRAWVLPPNPESNSNGLSGGSPCR